MPGNHSMVVGIDGRPANARKRAGIGNYCYELLRAMVGVGEGVALRVYLAGPPLEGFPLGPDQAEIRMLRPGRAWTLRRLSRELRRDPPDVFLTTGIQVPLFCACPKVATVLDLAPMTFPKYFTWQRRIVGPLRARLAAHTADRLLAISEATKQDLVRLLGVPDERITVVHLAASAAFRPCEDAATIQRVRDACGLPERYILYVGRLQPRKNIARLIQAFELLRQRWPDLPHKLILAGDKGWLYDDIYKAAQRSEARDFIEFLGFVEERDLPALISEADALVLVSLWEGFGLPVVEAMACGTAVVTSNCSSLPEVAGDAALTVDPYDVAAISRAIEAVVCDEGLRRDLEQRGLARARKFTWANTAETVMKALKQSAANRD